MQPVEVQTLMNGEPKSVVMPPLHHPLGAGSPELVAGPDVIVGDLAEMSQFGINGTLSGWEWERLLVITAISRWIGSHCRTLIIRLFRRTSTA